MRSQIESNKVIAFPEGRIDSSNSAEMSKDLNEIIAANPGLVLEIDAGNLEYISSTGLRVLLQVRKALNRPLTVRNVSPDVYEVLEMTGFTDLLDVKKKMREVSVEGCEIVGQGAVGTVYRMDEDTIVKVYNLPDSLPMIENESRRAKQAFLKGIPTAISYDVVKVGDKYGSVFEMIKASTYHDLVLAHPEKMDEYLCQYARFLRQLHAVEADPGELPDARSVFTGYLEKLRGILPADLDARLRELFAAMPENLHLIHGDIQMKNVMLSGDEPLLIDMDTLSVGDPVFDLMGLYIAYVLFALEEPGNMERFLNMPDEMAASVWEKTIRYYFEDLDRPALEEAKTKIMIVASVRFLFLTAVLGIGLPELKEVRTENTIARLNKMIARVDSLAIGSV